MSAIVLERDERVVLQELGRLGVLQLTRARADPDSAPLHPRDQSKEMASCAGILARVHELQQSLEIPPLPRDNALMEMTLAQAEERLRSMEQRADILLSQRRLLLQRLSESAAICERLSSYRGLDIPLDPPGRPSFLHFITGTLPAENLAVLQREAGDNVAVVPLPEQNGRQPLIAMTTRQGRVGLEDVLQRIGFQHEILPTVEGATTDSLAESSESEREVSSVELNQLNAQLHTLADEYAQPLAEIQRFGDTERRLIEAEQHFSRTEAAILITGWVPAAEAPALETHLREVIGDRCVIETIKPGNSSEEEPPVLLRQPWLMRPFEMLVSAYGLPNYRELEPTLFVALSYLIMFGMMFGDVGHGALLAAGGLIAMLRCHAAKMQDVGLLLLLGGLSSMVFGVVYGSYFGLDHFKKYALWHDPLEGDPMHLMYGAIGLGIGMISLGLILNIINRLQSGDVIGGLLGKFGVIGLLFYWGTLFLISQYGAIQSHGLVSLAVVLFLLLPIFGWALKEPTEYLLSRRAGHPIEPGSGLFAAVTESFVGAFEAVLSYLANTVSFVRLAAYAMSHAALLAAAFLMAREVRRFSVGGDVLGILVIILGNLVAILLEGIIASVQALRLEYYEFFGKFFSGNGQPFTPFRLVTNEQIPA